MTKNRPLLSDIQPTQIQFHPGDRILVRVSVGLTADQRKRLERSVAKFTGEDVRILLVNCLTTGIVQVRGQIRTSLVDSSQWSHKSENPGVLNMKCSAVDLQADDKLIVSVPSGMPRRECYSIVESTQRWAGLDVEVITTYRTEQGNGR